jgi:alpha-L-arabinofuranosidase
MLHSIARRNIGRLRPAWIMRDRPIVSSLDQGKTSVTEASVVVEDHPIGTVSRQLYGHFAEHLGRCRPHMGAEALQVELDAEIAGPFGSPALTATASRTGGGVAVTLINRQYGGRPITANIYAAGIVSSSWLLTADSSNAVNDLASPERVSPRRLAVEGSLTGRCTVTMPPHSMATIEFAASGATGV